LGAPQPLATNVLSFAVLLEFLGGFALSGTRIQVRTFGTRIAEIAAEFLRSAPAKTQCGGMLADPNLTFSRLVEKHGKKMRSGEWWRSSPRARGDRDPAAPCRRPTYRMDSLLNPRGAAGHSRRSRLLDCGWPDRAAAVIDRVVPCLDGCRRGIEATRPEHTAGAVSSRLEVCRMAFGALARAKTGALEPPKKACFVREYAFADDVSIYI